MNGGIEKCAHRGCNKFPQFPDENGYIHCRDCYTGDPEFSHVPDEERRKELIEMYPL
jgi:hypothetical protein